jgi:hypothetical protein
VNKMDVNCRTTRETDVLRRSLIVVDVDSIRDHGCFTDEQKNAAYEVFMRVVAFLREHGWPEPILVDSGNIKSRELVQKGLETQHSVVIATNQELRGELQRIKQSQDALKQSVKDMIDAGLEDIKSRLGQISVTEILGEVPRNPV